MAYCTYAWLTLTTHVSVPLSHYLVVTIAAGCYSMRSQPGQGASQDPSQPWRGCDHCDQSLPWLCCHSHFPCCWTITPMAPQAPLTSLRGHMPDSKLKACRPAVPGCVMLLPIQSGFPSQVSLSDTPGRPLKMQVPDAGHQTQPTWVGSVPHASAPAGSRSECQHPLPVPVLRNLFLVY